MRFEIKSYESIGKIKLGMPRDEIRPSLGRYVSDRNKDFFDNGLTLEYGGDALGVISVEGSGDVDIVFQGEHLLQTPIGSLVHLMKKWDAKTTFDESGMTSLALGISIYAPDWEERDDECPDAVLMFCHRYYEL